MIKNKEEYRSILEQRLNEADERIDAMLARNLAKHGLEQAQKHLQTLTKLGVHEKDPRVLETKQQIEDHKRTLGLSESIQYLSEALTDAKKKKNLDQLRNLRVGAFWYHPATGAFHHWPDGGYTSHAEELEFSPRKYGLPRNEEKRDAVIQQAQDGDHSYMFNKGWVRGFYRATDRRDDGRTTVYLHGRDLSSLVRTVRLHSSHPNNIDTSYLIDVEKPDFSYTSHHLRTPTLVDKFLSNRGAPHRDYTQRGK